VLDLDNTLWGGVIAEDGLDGVQLGPGSPAGEAYVAFQEYVRALKERGVVLAVVSKNNDGDAREPFLKHPDMRLRLEDFAVFLANWDDKATNIRRVAEILNVGRDSLVFVDDNPAEREIIRQKLPEVEVISMPPDPARYVRAVSESLLFEIASFTAEDAARSAQYAARAAALEVERGADSLEEFYASLQMEAATAPFDAINMPRIAQLVGKTNQFNLTTRRYSLHELESFAKDPDVVTMYLRLRDTFTDHGLAALLIARDKGGSLDIETWLMSCRIIGRTVENEMFRRLCITARARGLATITGTYVPSEKNAVVRDLYERLGWVLVGTSPDGVTTWNYDLAANGLPESGFIGEWSDVAVHA